MALNLMYITNNPIIAQIADRTGVDRVWIDLEQNNKGTVSEGPGSCFFIVKDNTLITPTLSDSVLESITRDTVIKLAKYLNIEVIERSIEKEELHEADEAFLCGSAMEITPVLSIDMHQITLEAGNVTSSILHNTYLDVVKGNNQDFIDWVTAIY